MENSNKTLLFLHLSKFSIHLGCFNQLCNTSHKNSIQKTLKACDHRDFKVNFNFYTCSKYDRILSKRCEIIYILRSHKILRGNRWKFQILQILLAKDELVCVFLKWMMLSNKLL